MASKVGANKRTLVHKESGGTVSFMPDVCKTPQPSGPPVPIPYPNMAVSQDADKGAKSVTVDGNPILVQGSTFAKSTGDEAGSAGGVLSASTKGEAEFVSYSFDVFAENKGVARAFDLMLGNRRNTPPMPEVQPPLEAQAASPGELEPDAVEVIVRDPQGKPLADVRYVIETPDGQKIEGKTDSSGKVSVKETRSGLGRVIFPDLEPGRNVYGAE